MFLLVAHCNGPLRSQTLTAVWVPDGEADMLCYRLGLVPGERAPELIG